LSGILLTESFGPVIGSAAFFNDLARELIAIMLIPGLIRRSRSTALGLCGATSMDFTLPVLQRTGGLELAHGGTLFLEKIEYLAVELQSALLQVIKQGVITRLDARRLIPIDVKVIATTTADLAMLVEQNRFSR
ncbi:MAG: hypothetical protein Q609_ECAC02229G0001, partial [Escherichia coli DORA_A_5_14_21]